MNLVSDFEGFLLEGRYDKLTGEICSEIMKKIKETNTGSEKIGKIKVIYKETDAVPSFEELLDKEKYFSLETFTDNISGIDVSVNLILIRDLSPEYEGDFLLDARTDDHYSIIHVFISLDPKTEPKCYLEISLSLRNLIRHEVEHLTQGGWNEKEGKRINRNDTTRRKIAKNPDIRYRYYKLKDEVPANLHGFYSEAKSRKIPFRDLVNSYLDNQVKKGIIPPNRRNEIYNLWKKEAKKIGGLPPL